MGTRSESLYCCSQTMGRLLRLVNDRSTFWDWMVLRARHRPSRAVVSPRRPQFLASFARDFELFPYVRQSSHINTTPTEVCLYYFECPSDSHWLQSPRSSERARHCASLRQELKNLHVATGGTLSCSGFWRLTTSPQQIP
jgi:hypothetical protein